MIIIDNHRRGANPESLVSTFRFLPIPWANTKGQHLSPDWQLHLPADVVGKLTTDCRNIVHQLLVRKPQKRLSLKNAMIHAFFSRVPWPRLASLNGPNLSKFRNSEDFSRQRFEIDSLYANFSQKTRKSCSAQSNTIRAYRPRKQTGKETENSPSQRSKVARKCMPNEASLKRALSINPGMSNANRNIDNNQIDRVRLQSDSNSGSKASYSVGKKQSKKQQHSV